MLSALVSGDGPLAHRLALDLLARGVPFDDIVTTVLTPVQAELGQRWAAGDLGVADEHASSAIIETLLVRLGAVAESPDGPAVVVATPEHDAHALGGRVVASALALDGCRVMFLGTSVPAAHLAEFLDAQRPVALALSCSMVTALEGVARSVDAAHELAIPVVGGGRALPTHERATRLGLDAHAQYPAVAVDVVRRWADSPPHHLARAPKAIPEHTGLARRSHALVAAALEATNEQLPAPGLAEELRRVLQVVESALLVDEPGLIDEHVHWLLETGPSHGIDLGVVQRALVALHDAMDGELDRAGAALRAALG